MLLKLAAFKVKSVTSVILMNSVVTVSHLARSVDFGSVLRKKTAVSVQFSFHFTTQQQSVVTAPAAAVTK